MTFRPSLLPKLAACPQYRPQEGDPGEAANRGTALDVAFRDCIINDSDSPVIKDREDYAAVQWSVRTLRLFASATGILGHEDDLKIDTCGMDGTADACCPDKCWSADLKTGKERNYLEQQAAYALGFMDKYFTDHWTVYLLFCDERKVVTLHFSREQAEGIVRNLLASAKDPHAKASPCDYCGWCAKQWTCKTRLEPLSMLLTGAPDKLDVESIKTDPVKLGKVMAITHEISKDNGLHDELRKAAVEHLGAKRDVPGWRLQAGRETRTVPALQLQANHGTKNLLKDAGTQRVMDELGNMSAAKFEKLWRETYSQEVPDGIIQTNHGAPFVARQKQPKNQTAN